MPIENVVTFLNYLSHVGKIKDPNSIKLRPASYENMQKHIVKSAKFSKVAKEDIQKSLRKVYGTASHRIKVPGAKIENMFLKVENGIEIPYITTYINNNKVEEAASDSNKVVNFQPINNEVEEPIEVASDSNKVVNFQPINNEVEEPIEVASDSNKVVNFQPINNEVEEPIEVASDSNKVVDFQPIGNKVEEPVEEKDEGEDIAKKVQDITNGKLANPETKVEASYFTPTDVENNGKVKEKEDFELSKIEDKKPIEEKDVSVVNASISDFENLKGIALPKEFIEKIQNSKAQADKMTVEAEQAQEDANKAQEEVEKAKAELAEKQKMVTEALEDKYSQEAAEAKKKLDEATDKNKNKKAEEKNIKAQIEQLEAFKREALNNKNSQDVSKMFDNSSSKEETSSIRKVA